MREHLDVEPMCFLYRGANHFERHVRHFAAALNRTREELDAIRTRPRLCADTSDSIRRCGNGRNFDVIGTEVIADINRRLGPERLARSQNAWSAQLAAIDAAAQCGRVRELRANVEDRGKAPAVDHNVQLVA